MVHLFCQQNKITSIKINEFSLLFRGSPMKSPGMNLTPSTRGGGDCVECSDKVTDPEKDKVTLTDGNLIFEVGVAICHFDEIL
jgi:hypothetical protein